MGESTCLMHSLPEPNNHGNHVHVLGDSVSFGRFTSESLAWEKWSTFSHKRYVEEAKSYAQPGSVAQKKAFFEAHYKKVAAQKAAAAAAALLEQEKDANATSPKSHDSPSTISNPHASQHKLQPESLNLEKIVNEEQQIVTQKIADVVELGTEKIVAAASIKKKDSLNKIEDHVSVSEDSRTSQMDRPLLKSKLNTDQEVLQPRNRRKPATPSFKSTSVNKKQARIPPSPSKYVAFMQSRKENIKNSTTMETVDKKRIAPRSLYTLMNSGSVKESCKLNSNGVQKLECKKPVPTSHSTPKRYPTPTTTPSKVKSGVTKQPLATPSMKRSCWKQNSKSKMAHFLSCKLEEKFNEKEAQKVQLQTSLKEKAETEFRRLRQSFCFKARPLPSFYNERETPKSMMKKIPQVNPRSLTPARKPPSTITSQPSSIKKSSRRLWKNNDQNPINHPLSELARRISHENISPNIQ
ncbi:hypothetical protein L2E82_19726 [Cichorium intybus]|uniref:Uncharacterized protein n=1 Tax=Cichorium intybus TaxID=13427 RepID=A0ACB9FCR2_CICIN|nr:hypothetical protein L2E82_19726 [Cichorium intybus]